MPVNGVKTKRKYCKQQITKQIEGADDITCHSPSALAYSIIFSMFITMPSNLLVNAMREIIYIIIYAVLARTRFHNTKYN